MYVDITRNQAKEAISIYVHDADMKYEVYEMKTVQEWKSTEEELMDLREWRKELKDEVNRVSRKIHILSTSLNQHKKKEELK